MFTKERLRLQEGQSFKLAAVDSTILTSNRKCYAFDNKDDWFDAKLSNKTV